MHYPSLLPLLLVTCISGDTVLAQETTTLPNSVGGVRGYDESTAVWSSSAVQFESHAEPERASLGSPAVIAIVVGCIAVIAFAIVVAYRTRDPPELLTPNEEQPTANVISTKSSKSSYQQSFDKPARKPTATTFEPHSPRMPPPPPAHTAIAPPPRRLAAPHVPTQNPHHTDSSGSSAEEESVVVVAM